MKTETIETHSNAVNFRNLSELKLKNLQSLFRNQKQEDCEQSQISESI